MYLAGPSAAFSWTEAMLTATSTTAVVAAAAVTVGIVAVVGVASARSRRKRPTKLTKDTIKAFMSKIDAVVSDCDGVIWAIGPNGIPNAKEAMECLKAAGKKVMYATNNSVLGPMEKFKRHGYDVKPNDVAHPSMAITSYFRKINFQKKIFVLAVERFKDEMRRGGLRVLPDTKNGALVEETLESILRNLDLDPDVGAVVVDMDINLSYTDINKAVNYLLRPGCHLYAGATDQSVTFQGGKVVVGPGPILKILEELSGKKAEIVGKPGPMMVKHFLKDEHDLDLSRTVFVGDTLVQDMGVANACGMVKLLVLTGMTKLEDLDTCPAHLMPDYYIDSLGDVVALLQGDH